MFMRPKVIYQGQRSSEIKLYDEYGMVQKKRTLFLLTCTTFTLGRKLSSTSLRSSSISVYDKCKQVQVDLSHIKMVEF